METITAEYNSQAEIDDEQLDRDNWESFIKTMNTIMRKIDTDELNSWILKCDNIGWQNRSGYKVVEASDALSLILEMTPTTECRYKVTYDSPEYFEIIMYHHDSPTGENYKVSLY